MPRTLRLAFDPFALVLVAFAAVACDPEPSSEIDAEARGCDACAPPPKEPAHACTDRPILDVAGQLDPQSEDVSADLQAAIEFATLNGWAAGLSPGTYRLASPLRLAQGAHFIGSGPDTVLVASTAPGAWAYDEALVEIVGVDDVAVCNMTLDHHGQSRVEDDEQLSFTMLISNANHNRVRGVVFRNPGASVKRKQMAKGPALLLLARNKNDPSYFPEGHVGEVGSASSNSISGNRFEIEPSTRIAYALRLYATGLNAEHITSNTIYRNEFTGEFFWNTVELTGQTTQTNYLWYNRFDGATLAHVAFTEGASRNWVMESEITRASRPSWLVGEWAPPDGGPAAVQLSSAIMTRGISVFEDGNIIEGNHIARFDEPEPHPVEHADSAAILLIDATDSTVALNVIDDVFAGTHGAAIRLVGGTGGDGQLRVHRNVIGHDGLVREGVIGSGTDDSRILVGGNDIITTASAIRVGRVPNAYGTFTEIYDNDIVVAADSGSDAVSVEADEVLVRRNAIDGGRSALFAEGEGTIELNRAGGTSDYTYRIRGTFGLTDNEAYGTGLLGSEHPHCGTDLGVLELGNDFVCGEE